MAAVARIGAEPERERDEHPLIAATRAKLAEAGREGTVEGQAALLLAERMTSPLNTGSSVASLNAQLHATMQRALAGAEKAADPVADLAARRAARAAGQ